MVHLSAGGYQAIWVRRQWLAHQEAMESRVALIDTVFNTYVFYETTREKQADQKPYTWKFSGTFQRYNSGLKPRPISMVIGQHRPFCMIAGKVRVYCVCTKLY